MSSGVHLGDCIAWLDSLEACSVDAIVTDPPYELTNGNGKKGFMGKAWDGSGIAHSPRLWAACLRVLKPGGHLVAFGGTRTVHRLTCAVEDAGFEVRDTIHWCYASGFPKSLNVSKAIDAAAGAEREVVAASPWDSRKPNGSASLSSVGLNASPGGGMITAPATPEAARWEGFGTALKPSVEPAVLARKPLGGTVAATVLKHGTGALNIDATRFAPGAPEWVFISTDSRSLEDHHKSTRGIATKRDSVALGAGWGPRTGDAHPGGRWPANLIYVPKPSRSERERGTEGLPGRVGDVALDEPGRAAVLRCPTHGASFPSGANGGRYSCGCRRQFDQALTSRAGHEAVGRKEGSAGLNSPRAGAGRSAGSIRNFHPTVKATRLMRWLVRLVTPPGGLVIDPFTGSGTTGVAAALEGFRFAGAELGEDYHRIAEARIAHAKAYPSSWLDTRPGAKLEANDEIEHLQKAGQIDLFTTPPPTENPHATSRPDDDRQDRPGPPPALHEGGL